MPINTNNGYIENEKFEAQRPKRKGEFPAAKTNFPDNSIQTALPFFFFNS